MPITDIEEKRRYQRDWVARRRQAWIDAQGGKCALCGSVTDLEVDHRDPETKLCNPTKVWSRSAEFRAAELAKCQVLCKSCHDVKSGREESPHGSAKRYGKHGCRCDACRAWNSSRVRKQRAS